MCMYSAIVLCTVLRARPRGEKTLLRVFWVARNRCPAKKTTATMTRRGRPLYTCGTIHFIYLLFYVVQGRRASFALAARRPRSHKPETPSTRGASNSEKYTVKRLQISCTYLTIPEFVFFLKNVFLNTSCIGISFPEK